MREFSENTTIVVLDDDPTGTQTVHNIPVLTTWEEETLEEMFRAGTPLFYILTNSRAFSEEEAVAINEQIGEVFKKTGRKIPAPGTSHQPIRFHASGTFSG